jgi:hypothetical protein
MTGFQIESRNRSLKTSLTLYWCKRASPHSFPQYLFLPESLEELDLSALHHESDVPLLPRGVKWIHLPNDEALDKMKKICPNLQFVEWKTNKVPETLLHQVGHEMSPNSLQFPAKNSKSPFLPLIVWRWLRPFLFFCYGSFVWFHLEEAHHGNHVPQLLLI